ncbi:MAG TPA: MBL fold metallo-hydrolase [Thermoleophilaceae bacterium]|nr:MBL fold metallo-hydrolase [Thermoleophilaceae bacterium]
MVTQAADAVVEIAAGTWRLGSVLGGRNVYQYLVASEDGSELLLVDTGTTYTPRDVIAPALRRLDLAPDALRLAVVTHPDVDHQGGLAGIAELCANAVTACGFADRALVAHPEQLLSDRYQPYLEEHGLGYGDEDVRWIRSHYGGPVEIELTLAGGELLRVGERELRVLHVPGHSAGHLALHEPASGLLFSSDAVHWTGCPGVDGAPALCPTYEEVDAYLGSIELLEQVAPSELHSGHWPTRSGAEVETFLDESREFVALVDRVLLERLAEPATLGELCEAVQDGAGPWESEAQLLMFAVSGHVRRLQRQGSVGRLETGSTPARYRLTSHVDR